MSSASIRSQIDTLMKQLAGLQKNQQAHNEKASKASQACAGKIQQAGRTSSASSAKSYLNSAAQEEKKALAEQKKSAEIGSKIADINKKISEKQKSLDNALKNERQKVEREEKSRQNKIDQETRKRQQKEKEHAREIARLSRPEIRHVIVEPPKKEKLRILYLTSNPYQFDPKKSDQENNSYLRTDAEVNSVLKELRGAKYRDLVDLQIRPAASPQDLMDGINDMCPHVVHFSGHGNSGILAFDNASLSDPQDIIVQFDILAEILAATNKPPKLLVMNSCSSLHGSDIILEAVPVVIGMKDSVGDAAAGVFATQFYSAIASAQSVGNALKQAKARIKLALMRDDSELPTIVNRDDVDPDILTLVTEHGASES